MVALLALSFAALLVILTAIEQSDQGSVEEWAQSDFTASRLKNLLPMLPYVGRDQLGSFVRSVSKCHDGYAISHGPYPGLRRSAETARIATTLADALGLTADAVSAGRAILTNRDFAYGKCPPGEMEFPFEGLVISVRQSNGLWVHAEVHPHEWHLRQSLISWVQRAGAIFLVIGAVAMFFIYRLARPLGRLAEASSRFGEGLKVDPIEVSGPLDVRRTIEAFNAMQQGVVGEVARRTNTLAALSHDLRTPLAGLRMKTELIDDREVRADLIVSIQKMEAIANSALEFLRGEARDEPMRDVDLTALVESECVEFEERGGRVRFEADRPVRCRCRPVALGQAVRNLIDNALKYAEAADVSVHRAGGWIEVVVRDGGPGIPESRVREATEPFVRLSAARESEKGGFGVGLAVVKAVAEGHGGQLILGQNHPSGLIAVIFIPDSLGVSRTD